jgi:hypothetical protein
MTNRNAACLGHIARQPVPSPVMQKGERDSVTQLNEEKGEKMYAAYY